MQSDDQHKLRGADHVLEEYGRGAIVTKWQFSLRTLLLWVVVIAMLTSSLRMYYEVVVLGY